MYISLCLISLDFDSGFFRLATDSGTRTGLITKHALDIVSPFLGFNFSKEIL
jgi:hypothetical protein